MKLFVVLSVVALAAARPQYNYDRPTGNAGGVILGGGNGFNAGGVCAKIRITVIQVQEESKELLVNEEEIKV